MFFLSRMILLFTLRTENRGTLALFQGGRQSWTFKKTSVLVLKRRFFLNVQLWRPVEADPVGVQRRALSHFKGLFKTVKMRYSTYLYSYWIGLKYPFQKSRFQAKTPWKRAPIRWLMSMCVGPFLSNENFILMAEIMAASAGLKEEFTYLIF